VEWQYDALGRRIRQTTSSWLVQSNLWVVTEDLKFVSDPLLYGRHVVDLNTSNNVAVRSYVWGLDLSETLEGAGGVGGLLWVTLHPGSGPAAGTHFCAYDGNGNVVVLVNASDGSVTARYEYGPFGEPIRVTGPAANQNPFRFSTKRTCNTSDLVLYEYRVYSPSTGRWANRDPINEPGFNLLIRTQNPFDWDEEKNLCGFVHNDPMKLVDADGRAPVVAMFFYGNAIGNIGIACYSCKKLDECLESAKKHTRRAGEKLDPEKFQEWIRAAKPGSECIGLAEDCGVRVISAIFWVSGRLLILRYLATK